MLRQTKGFQNLFGLTTEKTKGFRQMPDSEQNLNFSKSTETTFQIASLLPEPHSQFSVGCTYAATNQFKQGPI